MKYSCNTIDNWHYNKYGHPQVLFLGSVLVGSNSYSRLATQYIRGK